jgi:hypothetical protein
MGVENEVFGVVTLPDPWPEGRERLADAAYAVHRAAAIALALKHHLDGDGVLARMVWKR